MRTYPEILELGNRAELWADDGHDDEEDEEPVVSSYLIGL
jgi:hypothetical protein